jgi:hypothetical protein
VAGYTAQDGTSDLRTLVRVITLVVAELVFVALIGKFVYETWDATGNTPPDLSGVQASAAGALAVAFGAGYAAFLGVPAETAQFRIRLKGLFKEKAFAVLGVIVYMLAGFATCITYGLNEDETPAVLRTIAVAFGGYVIAFVGSAMRQVSD